MMTNNATKIIATIGPSCQTKDKIKDLVLAGADVFRLNFSHGTIKSHSEEVKYIRQVEKELKKPIGIIADLQGPKLRIGQFQETSVELTEGQEFILDMNEKKGNVHRVCLPHKEIFDVLKKDMELLLNDGKIRLKVVSHSKTKAKTIVQTGGVLSDHKGVNVPDVHLPISALTQKDISDLKAALKMGVDWIALSFVQSKEDVLAAKKYIKDKAWIIVKIEKPTAVNNIDAIIDATDAIMVARGDLGVESSLEKLPFLQKQIILKCRKAGKPVIVATQMLESMINAPLPTRAEVSDVATAVYEGADCVMLSAETAAGSYPVEAVQMMDRIIYATEHDPFYKKIIKIFNPPIDHDMTTAITSSIPHLADVLKNAKTIVTYSLSGRTTLCVAKERALLPILNLTKNINIVRRCTLVWGVQSVLVPSIKSFAEVGRIANKQVLKGNMAQKGDEIIIIAGMPFSLTGRTNNIHISVVR